SNLEPIDYESTALPIELPRRARATEGKLADAFVNTAIGSSAINEHASKHPSGYARTVGYRMVAETITDPNRNSERIEYGQIHHTHSVHRTRCKEYQEIHRSCSCL